MNPGIFGRNYSVQSPMSEVIEVVASSFPKVVNPDLIMIQKTVLTA
jgi:hypothetical protein